MRLEFKIPPHLSSVCSEKRDEKIDLSVELCKLHECIVINDQDCDVVQRCLAQRENVLSVVSPSSLFIQCSLSLFLLIWPINYFHSCI